MPSTTIDVPLPAALDAHVRERVAEGRFSTPADYVLALIRADLERRAEERLEELLMEGINSGPAVPMTDEDWAYIRAEARRRAGPITSGE